MIRAHITLIWPHAPEQWITPIAGMTKPERIDERRDLATMAGDEWS